MKLLLTDDSVLILAWLKEMLRFFHQEEVTHVRKKIEQSWYIHFFNAYKNMKFCDRKFKP